MINPDMCSCCGEIWNRENLKNIPMGKHKLHLCPDCYIEYIKPFNEIISGLKAHKWNKDEGLKAIYNSAIDDATTCVKEYSKVVYDSAIDDAITYIEEYTNRDAIAQATDFLAEARGCAESEDKE